MRRAFRERRLAPASAVIETRSAAAIEVSDSPGATVWWRSACAPAGTASAATAASGRTIRKGIDSSVTAPWRGEHRCTAPFTTWSLACAYAGRIWHRRMRVRRYVVLRSVSRSQRRSALSDRVCASRVPVAVLGWPENPRRIRPLGPSSHRLWTYVRAAPRTGGWLTSRARAVSAGSFPVMDGFGKGAKPRGTQAWRMR